MRSVTITCDVCETPKLEANHWFIATVVDGASGHASYQDPLGSSPRPRTIIISEWEHSTQEAIDKADKHLCGIGCVGKLVSEWGAR